MNYAVDSINRYFAGKATVTSKVAIDTFFIKKVKKASHIEIHFKESISEYPLRDTDIIAITDIIRNNLPKELKYCELELYTKKGRLSRLSSGFYSGRPFTNGTSGQQPDRKIWITRKHLTITARKAFKGEQ